MQTNFENVGNFTWQFVYERRSFRRVTIPAPLVYARALKYVILFSL